MMNFPHIYEAEVIDTIDSPNQGGIYYSCVMTLPNGHEIVVPYAKLSSMFGGIGDYFQNKIMTSADGDGYKLTESQPARNARVGARVYIAFISGSINKPIIIGFAEHPSQTAEFKSDSLPQSVLQVNGVRAHVDEDGQLRIIHKGLPTVKDTGGSQLTATPSLSSNKTLGATNPAIDPAPDTEVSIFEMLSEGIIRARDAEGQVIEFDRTQKTILISNNNLKSTEESHTSGTDDAESILFDKDNETIRVTARKIVKLHSLDQRNDLTDGNYSHKIGKDNAIDVGGNEKITIGGAQTVDVSKDSTWKVGANYSVKATSSLTLEGSGGAKLKLDGGKVGLGGAGGELLDLISQFLQSASDTVTEISTHVHPSAVGPTAIPVSSPTFAKLSVTFTKIKALIDSIKGGV
jgi:hypothetical protein